MKGKNMILLAVAVLAIGLFVVIRTAADDGNVCWTAYVVQRENKRISV
jgi:hypothetical protein